MTVNSISMFGLSSHQRFSGSGVVRVWRYLFWLSALSIATMETSAAANSTGTEIAIWQGLAYGMTPEEALPIIQGIAGVKRTKVIKAQRSNPARRLDIDYNSSKISIANPPFELGPVFENGRLKQVILAVPRQHSIDRLAA